MTTALRTPPVVDDVTRRQLLTVLGAAGLLTACSTPSTAATAPAASVTWGQGPFGPVDAPRDPRRVVACNSIDADFALVLGLTVIGTSGGVGTPGTPFAAYHAERLTGVVETLTGGEPNVEQVAALRPDLILDSWDTERPRYDNWSAIAPTVNFAPVLYPDDFARTDWPAALRALGATFGREEAAEDAVAAYLAAIDAERARLPIPPGASFAGVNVFEGVQVIDAGQQISRVAVDLGLTPHPLVAPVYGTRTVLSLEEVGRLADVDVLFVAVPGSSGSLDRDRSAIDPVVGSPLWQRLPAVTAGRVVEYPGELYYASPLTAPALATALADGLA